MSGCVQVEPPAQTACVCSAPVAHADASSVPAVAAVSAYSTLVLTRHGQSAYNKDNMVCVLTPFCAACVRARPMCTVELTNGAYLLLLCSQFTGLDDPPLSEQGREQAHHMARLLVSYGYVSGTNRLFPVWRRYRYLH